MKNMNILKDKAIFLGWIMGLLIIISLVWILTQPAQANYLLRSVNNILLTAGDSRRLVSYTPKPGGKAQLMGYWYLMNNAERMFVFACFQDGILVPVGAVVSDNGKVSEIIPLSSHAVQVFDFIPQSILQMYVTRIESASGSGGK
ncbi:MAG: hypothetical protein LBH16_00855 [Treponema sp.]|jgi:hypothetical protein|nr:hypothetical protein [Treponema sp.]